MNRRALVACFLFTLLAADPLLAAPRDAAAVLNRCGNPLKGDTTILESTVTGGRRLLNYERGTIHFDKVANDGWTFSYGSHGKLDHLTAAQMEKYMPCLKDALADSAKSAPLVPMTPVERVEVSAKRGYKTLILYALGLVVLLGLVLLAFSRKPQPVEEDIG